MERVRAASTAHLSFVSQRVARTTGPIQRTRPPVIAMEWALAYLAAALAGVGIFFAPRECLNVRRRDRNGGINVQVRRLVQKSRRQDLRVFSPPVHRLELHSAGC